MQLRHPSMREFREKVKGRRPKEKSKNKGHVQLASPPSSCCRHQAPKISIQRQHTLLPPTPSLMRRLELPAHPPSTCRLVAGGHRRCATVDALCAYHGTDILPAATLAGAPGRRVVKGCNRWHSDPSLVPACYVASRRGASLTTDLINRSRRALLHQHHYLSHDGHRGRRVLVAAKLHRICCIRRWLRVCAGRHPLGRAVWAGASMAPPGTSLVLPGGVVGRGASLVGEPLHPHPVDVLPNLCLSHRSRHGSSV